MIKMGCNEAIHSLFSQPRALAAIGIGGEFMSNSCWPLVSRTWVDLTVVQYTWGCFPNWSTVCSVVNFRHQYYDISMVSLATEQNNFRRRLSKRRRFMLWLWWTSPWNSPWSAPPLLLHQTHTKWWAGRWTGRLRCLRWSVDGIRLDGSCPFTAWS